MPYAIKVYLNGHEWAKQQLRKEGIAFEALDNGFLSCEPPERPQALSDQLGPEQIQAFFDKWIERLPVPCRRKIARPVTVIGFRSSSWRSAAPRYSMIRFAVENSLKP